MFEVKSIEFDGERLIVIVKDERGEMRLGVERCLSLQCRNRTGREPNLGWWDKLAEKLILL